MRARREAEDLVAVTVGEAAEAMRVLFADRTAWRKVRPLLIGGRHAAAGAIARPLAVGVALSGGNVDTAMFARFLTADKSVC